MAKNQPTVSGEAVVLLVDADPCALPALRDAKPGGRNLRILHVPTVAEAYLAADTESIDLALIDPSTAEANGSADGFVLAADLADRKQPVHTLIVSDDSDFDAARKACDAGAGGYLLKAEMIAEVLAARLHVALEKHERELNLHRRCKRLKKLCQKLSDARMETSAQVETLCNDLVTAYQELAVQVSELQNQTTPEVDADTANVEELFASSPASTHHLNGTEALAAMLDAELDLEPVLRNSLHWLTREAGPCNAAIFLPCSMDEYSLGGYVNYDVPAGAADMLLQHLADVLAPRTAEHAQPLHLTTNDAMSDWIGDDAAYLADSHVIAFAPHAADECLAVVVLFRDGEQPFDPQLVNTFAEASDVIGQRLEKIIKVHHRHLPDEMDGDDWGQSSWSPEDDDTLGYVEEDEDGGSMAA